ncbi:MAG: ABC transporter permease [Saprospiraceae bacterium]|nr:ABC transporter permease [Saprospiraceae bacterium]
MKQLKAFIIKEIYHILRDRKTILVLFGMPIMQILLFGFALSNEVKNTKIAIFDQNNSNLSHALINEIDASKYFDIALRVKNEDEMDRVLRSGKATMIVIIPSDFNDALLHNNSTTLQMLTDASNPNLASTIQTYLNAIIRNFKNTHVQAASVLPMVIDVRTKMLYNPQLVGAYTFVPGVIAMVLMIVCTLMTSVSIVKEKELGNMEILLVSPTHPLVIIFSKAIPYLILSLIIVTLIFGLSTTLLDVPIRGSILLLYFVCFIFIVTTLSLGLLISTLTNSQQIAMMISLMGLMLPTIMFGGFMFPIENMPIPLQVISNVIPAKWFYYTINDIMIKGLGFKELYKYILLLIGYASLFLFITFKKFNIRLS